MKQKNRENIRLYIETAISDEAVIGLDGNDTHYLKNVMRCREGDTVSLFNGRDGEWTARIDGFGKSWTSLTIIRQNKTQQVERSCILIFALIKRSRSDLLLQKATELGITQLQPVMTQRSQSERFNPDRALAVVKEAAEQSGRTSLPTIEPVCSLEKLLADWPPDRQLWFCDERAEAGSFVRALTEKSSSTMGDALLIGPEGGFDPKEANALRANENCHAISLGPRILRAETAALAAISILQSVRDATSN